MRVRRGCEVAGDKAGRGGHGVGMRSVLILLVFLAAVMGGEAGAVLVAEEAASRLCPHQVMASITREALNNFEE
jgi:hypothetical protein